MNYFHIFGRGVWLIMTQSLHIVFFDWACISLEKKKGMRNTCIFMYLEIVHKYYWRIIIFVLFFCNLLDIHSHLWDRCNLFWRTSMKIIFTQRRILGSFRSVLLPPENKNLHQIIPWYSYATTSYPKGNVRKDSLVLSLF